MFRFTINPLVTVLLIAATTLVSLVPASGSCDVMENSCGSTICCGMCCKPSDDSVRECCSDQDHQQVCRCSDDRKQPVVPVENRSHDQRYAVRVAGTASVGYVDRVDSTQRLALFSVAPSYYLHTPCQQAVLCRWLT